MADLYDDLTLPPALRKARQANDRAMMQACGFKTTMNEAEIVAALFDRYKTRLAQLAAEAARKAEAKKAAKKAEKLAEKRKNNRYRVRLS